MNKDFEPFISFPDQSSNFTYGCEYGRLLQKMEQGDKEISNNGLPIRIENKPLIETTCKKLGYTPIFGNEWFGWIGFIAIKNLSTDN